MYNLRDETVVERYLENPYWQHFCGEVYFQYRFPFDPSDFVHFRHRIGKEGMDKIFKQSIDLVGEDLIRKEVREVRMDTAVQEKYITYPMERKLYKKAIHHCKRYYANAHGISLERTYTREIKSLLLAPICKNLRILSDRCAPKGNCTGSQSRFTATWLHS